MDQYIKKAKNVVHAASSTSGDDAKESDLPDIAKLGKEISQEALKQIDDAITDLKKKLGEAKKKSKHATNQTEKKLLDFAIEKMEDALKALEHLRKDVQKELKKSGK